MFLLETCQTKCSSPCNVPDMFLPVSRYPCPQCVERSKCIQHVSVRLISWETHCKFDWRTGGDYNLGTFQMYPACSGLGKLESHGRGHLKCTQPIPTGTLESLVVCTPNVSSMCLVGIWVLVPSVCHVERTVSDAARDACYCHPVHYISYFYFY